MKKNHKTFLLTSAFFLSVWIIPSLSDVDFNYHNSAQLEAFLKNEVRKYPEITNLYSIGKSVQGNKSIMLDASCTAKRSLLDRDKNYQASWM